MIRAEGISLAAGGRWILQAVTLTVGAGEVVIVTGVNGSGKSLLGRALLGLAPVAGRVTVDGRLVTSGRGRRLIGYLPQGAPLYSDLTVAESLQLFAGVAGLPGRQREKVAGDLIELVGLAGLAAVAVARLSPGQRQRLSLARALVGDPSALVLDEPLSDLDEQSKGEVLHLLAELRQMGKAILILTGDPAGLPNDRVLYLENGVLKRGVLA